MTETLSWSDADRDALRDDLRATVLGEVRLAVADDEEILERCREVFIEDVCPEAERESFVAFAREELARVTASHAVERRAWPPETDCDRLDRAQAVLQERGILLWQVSPCCDTCTRAELGDRIETIQERAPGFAARARGYAFFIEQNMAEALAEDPTLKVFLGYGWFGPESEPVPDDVYRRHAVAIAEEVCECLREHGFEPVWNGDIARKIELNLRWLRRSRVE